MVEGRIRSQRWRRYTAPVELKKQLTDETRSEHLREEKETVQNGRENGGVSELSS